MSYMKKNTSSKSKIVQAQEKYTVPHALVNYYLLLMFTMFPLFATNGFFNIRHDKYYFYMALSLIMLLSEGLIIILSKNQKENSLSPAPCAWYKRFSFTDWAMLAFLAFSIISTALSANPVDALLGTAGRNNGLILIAVYVGIYFLITRYYYFMEYVFLAFAGASAVVFILAILNCFYVDPLGMFDRLSKKDVVNFTSTIGNKNLLSSYICIALPVFITFSVHTKKILFRAAYLAASGLGFASLMTSDSDSGILGMAAFIVIYFIWYSKKISRLKRFFLSMTTMLVSAKLLRLVSLIFNDKSKGMDSFQEFFVYSNASVILIAVFAVITALLYLIDYKKPNLKISSAIPFSLAIVLAVCITAVISSVIYFTFIDVQTKLNGVFKLLRINDGWGTHRGFMWIRSMRIFGDFSITEKLFGCGPDTFYYAFKPYFNELLKFGDSSTNAAHNEYINYLITVGLLGLGSYLAAIGGAIATAIKSARKNPFAIVFCSAVICYVVQATVNIAQPITTPLFFIFLALCQASGKKSDSIQVTSAD